MRRRPSFVVGLEFVFVFGCCLLAFAACGGDSGAGADAGLGADASTCTPREFLACEGNTYVTCDDSGQGETRTECPSGCDADGCKLCVAGELRCSNDDLQRCALTGDSISTLEVCALGCSTDGGPHCRTVVPAFAPEACTAARASEFDVPPDIQINSDTMCDDIIDRPGLPDLCLVYARSLELGADEQLQLVGARALMIVVYGPVQIEGRVRGYGWYSDPGPGALAANNPATGVVPANNSSGCGGGGGVTAGAAGGGFETVAGPAGGAAWAASLDEVLVGGATGGDIEGSGGAGGGGVSLVSCTGTLTIETTAVIDVSGGAGQGSFSVAGGGGSGGTLALQAAQIAFYGELAAIGGGGAGGSDGLSAGPEGLNGSDGGNGSGNGGDGGNGTRAAEAGQTGSNALQRKGGGGGGAAGRIWLYLPSGTTPTLEGQSTPAPSPVRTVTLR